MIKVYRIYLKNTLNCLEQLMINYCRKFKIQNLRLLLIKYIDQEQLLEMADKLISEFYEGNSRHLLKAEERLTGINKIISSGSLGLEDLDIAEALRDDLEYAISLFQ